MEGGSSREEWWFEMTFDGKVSRGETLKYRRHDFPDEASFSHSTLELESIYSIPDIFMKAGTNTSFRH